MEGRGKEPQGMGFPGGWPRPLIILVDSDEFAMNLGVVCRIIFDAFLIKCGRSPSEISFFGTS
jgi:hypothetical protein